MNLLQKLVSLSAGSFFSEQTDHIKLNLSYTEDAQSPLDENVKDGSCDVLPGYVWGCLLKI